MTHPFHRELLYDTPPSEEGGCMTPPIRGRGCMTQHYDNQLSQPSQSAHTTKTCVSEQTSGCPELTLPYQM